MKKFYIGIIGFIACLNSWGQSSRLMQSSTPVNLYIPTNNSLVSTPTDTLFGWLITGGTPSLVGATGGGYVTGNNGYGDKEKVEKFLVTTPYDVEGCLIWIGALDGSPNPTDHFTAQMYNIDATAASLNFGSTYPSPGTPMAGASVDVTITSIDTSSGGAAGFVYVTLPVPVNVVADYGFGVDFNSMYGNTGLYAGIVSSTTGDGGGLEMCFEKWSDDSWHTIMEGWNGNPDIDLGVFPIVNMITGINELSYVHGICLSKPSPNPVINTSVVNFALQQNVKNLKITVLDLNGKKVKEESFSNMTSGQHKYNIEASSLINGSYFIVINADGRNLAAKFQVAK